MSQEHSVNVVDAQLRSVAARRYYAEDLCMFVATGAIVNAMDAAGINRSELAQRIDRTPGFVSQVLNGSRNMTLKTFADLAAALDLQVNAINLGPLGEVRVHRRVAEAWQANAVQSSDPEVVKASSSRVFPITELPDVCHVMAI